MMLSTRTCRHSVAEVSLVPAPIFHLLWQEGEEQAQISGWYGEMRKGFADAVFCTPHHGMES